MTPIRERLTALLAERLAAKIPDVPVERARRGIVPEEDFPRLVLKGGDLASDDGEAFGETTYTASAVVVGYASADPDAENQDLSAEQALSELHARVVTALVGWQPDGVDLNEVRESGTAEFLAYDLDECATASGEFTAVFEAVSVRPTGHPYAA